MKRGGVLSAESAGELKQSSEDDSEYTGLWSAYQVHRRQALRPGSSVIMVGVMSCLPGLFIFYLIFIF